MFVLTVASMVIFASRGEALGWVSATVNGQSYFKDQGHSLPAGATCTTYETDKTKCTSCSYALLQWNQPGTVSQNKRAEIRFKYKVFPNDEPLFSGALVAFDIRRAESVSVNVYSTPGTGYASAAIARTKSKVGMISRSNVGESEEGGVWISGRRAFFRFPNVTWTPSGAGEWYTYVQIDSGFLASYAKAIWSGSGGNFPANISTATAPLEFEFSSAQDDLSSRMVTGNIANTANETIQYEIRSTKGVLLDSFSSDVDGTGNYFAPFGGLSDGIYDLVVFADGALQKKVQVTYDDAGVSNFNISLIWGDTDGDNQITQADLNFINSVLGKSSSDEEWDVPNAGGHTMRSADLNKDGSITSADYTIAYANLGLSGD